MSDYKVTSKITLKNSETKVVIEDAKSELKDVRRKLGELQDTLYAHGKYAVLICIQGMDTAGKDSLIREVFKDFNARGVVVHSFKVPTELALKHDYLWRHYIALPARGKFGVFNRTHYENVLVTRVHPEYVFSESIPTVKNLEDLNDDFYHSRMDRINQFEKHLEENGTVVLKFFLNLIDIHDIGTVVRLTRTQWPLSQYRKTIDNQIILTACDENRSHLLWDN